MATWPQVSHTAFSYSTVAMPSELFDWQVKGILLQVIFTNPHAPVADSKGMWAVKLHSCAIFLTRGVGVPSVL